MAQQTVLEIVQGILNEIEGDEVNSIFDTVESTSIANTLKQVFLDIVEEFQPPSIEQLASLEGLADLTKPNYLRIPEDASKVLWFQYDIRTDVSLSRNYRDICWMEAHDFIKYVNHRPSIDTTNYQTVYTSTGVPLTIRKTHQPEYWTTFDDTYVVLDGYNVNVDTTVQTSKNLAFLRRPPSLVLEDGNIPQLPTNLGRLLYTESLARCFQNHKGAVNAKAERNENRMRVRAMRDKGRKDRPNDTGPNYGRK